MFREVLLVGYTRSCMRSSASHTIHIDVPFITYDNYLLSIIRLFSGLLLLWDLVNNHLLNGRLFPFSGLLPWAHLSFIVPFDLWILLPSFVYHFILTWRSHLLVIIFIRVPHPSLLFIRCWLPDSSSLHYRTPLLILLLYLNSLLLDSLHCSCEVPKRSSPVCLFGRWIRRCLRWMIILLVKHFSAPRYFSRVGLVRLNVVERCAAAWWKVVTLTALEARWMWQLIEIVVGLGVAQDWLGFKGQGQRGRVQTTLYCHNIRFWKI